jgi:hypothetical protein
MRHPNDAYDTPPELALAIARTLSLPDGARVLEPTAGTGSFVAAIRDTQTDAKITAIDLDERCREPCRLAGADKFVACDVLTIPQAAFAPAALVIGNPPFKAADAIVRHIYPGLRDGSMIVFLLAITFWAGKDRWDPEGGLYTLAPVTHVRPIVPRPYFGLDNDPKFEAALFTWVKGEGRQVQPVRWDKPPKKERAKLRTFGGEP